MAQSFPHVKASAFMMRTLEMSLTSVSTTEILHASVRTNLFLNVSKRRSYLFDSRELICNES